MATTTLPVQFGILGCAEIARKISRAISLSPNSNIHAIGSRSIEKAQKFAADNGYPVSTKLYDSYEAVLDDPEVDAIYMPLPTSMHLEWGVLAAQKKKHLLLEKPVALNVEELDAILEACESNGVQFMDGTMWMHHPRLAKVQEFLSDPQLFGQLKFMHSYFTFLADEDYLKNNIRVKPDLDALGAIGDIGWYCIRITLLASDHKLPKLVIASRNPVINDAGVILSCGASLYWDDGKVATFQCSFLSNLTMDVTAVGTRGTLHLHDFNIPCVETEASYYTVSDSKFINLSTAVVPKRSHHVVTTELPQEARMITEFSRLVWGIKSHGAKPEKLWPSLSRKTQVVMDAVIASINNNFEAIEL